jgi:rubrerythrin
MNETRSFALQAASGSEPHFYRMITEGQMGYRTTRRQMKNLDKKPQYPMLCEECGKNYADPPSRVCPGCEAYREHQQ